MLFTCLFEDHLTTLSAVKTTYSLQRHS